MSDYIIVVPVFIVLVGTWVIYAIIKKKSEENKMKKQAQYNAEALSKVKEDRE